MEYSLTTVVSKTDVCNFGVVKHIFNTMNLRGNEYVRVCLLST